MQTVRRKCKKNKHVKSFDMSAAHGEPVGMRDPDADINELSGEEFKEAVKRSRGHVSDDDCKRRRKEKRQQRKQEKKKAKQERKARRQETTADGPTKLAHADPAISGEQEELEYDSPRTDNDTGSWISTSTSPLSSLSDDSTESADLHGSYSMVTTTSLSSSDGRSAEHSLELRRLRTFGSAAKRERNYTITTSISSSRLDFLSGVHIPASIGNIGDARKVDVRHVHMLYNPWSGNKKGERKMRKARRMLERAGKEVTVTKLMHKGHAEELCATMDFTGIDVLCSVGGDGTFHECVNGLMHRQNKKSPRPEEEEDQDAGEELNGPQSAIPPLAFIAAGTGNSFVHELGCPRISDSVRHIVRGIEVGVDLSRITYGEEECYSFNSIHWGIGSRVVDTAERFRWMGNSTRYIMAALVELMKGNEGRVRLVVTDENDEEIVWDEAYALGIANNIITAGKGMKLAPTAKIDDGLIDLLLFTSRAPRDLLAVLRKFYSGTHTNLPHVRYVKAKKFTVIPYKPSESSKVAQADHKSDADSASSETESEGKESGSDLFDDEAVELLKEVIDIDGELKGFTPFTCEVLPRAVRVIL